MAWSSWTPAVANGQCKDQTRYQDKRAEYTYQMKQDNCHGIDPNCNPSRINDKRTFCKLHVFLHTDFVYLTRSRYLMFVLFVFLMSYKFKL